MPPKTHKKGPRKGKGIISKIREKLSWKNLAKGAAAAAAAFALYKGGKHVIQKYGAPAPKTVGEVTKLRLSKIPEVRAQQELLGGISEPPMKKHASSLASAREAAGKRRVPQLSGASDADIKRLAQTASQDLRKQKVAAAQKRIDVGIRKDQAVLAKTKTNLLPHHAVDQPLPFHEVDLPGPQTNHRRILNKQLEAQYPNPLGYNGGLRTRERAAAVVTKAANKAANAPTVFHDARSTGRGVSGCPACGKKRKHSSR